MGGVNFYRKVFLDFFKRFHPINWLLRKGLSCIDARKGKINTRNPSGACDSADSGFPQLGCCRGRLTSVPPATFASTGLAPPSGRSKQTAP